MARKLGRKDKRHLARLVTGERAPCAFCLREVDDELTYGKLYAIGDIQVHYYCCLLSCCLIQKGSDEEGLFGFMYSDILAELERCKKHKCSYCGRSGANLGCHVGVCRKQFHLPCGRERHAVSQYFGSYKSFCQQHAPRQKIPEHILAKARLRARGIKSETDSEDVCLICYEKVDAFPTVHTFWPPCCGKDARFHRTCLQRMALSAGMHYLKCPLCNDKETFYEAVLHQGYHVPDRDAAWELEQNAFAEIYERPATCSMETCVCPMGREHDAETGRWDIKLCLLCGSAGAHAECIHQSESSNQKQLTVDQSQLTNQHQPNNQSEVIEQQELRDPNTSTKIKEEISETNVIGDRSDKVNSSILMSLLTSQMTNLTAEVSNVNSQISNLSTQVSNVNCQSNKVNSPILMSYLTSDMSNVNSRMSSEYSEISNVNSKMSNLPTQVTNMNSEVSNVNSQVSNSVLETEESFSPTKSIIRFVCKCCLPAAPADLSQLVSCIEAIIQSEQTQAQSPTTASRPLMPSRMSIRRTKRIVRPSTSRSNENRTENRSTDSPNITSSRQELNLKPPRRREERDSLLLEREGNILLSPWKVLEQGLREKMACSGVKETLLDEAVEALRKKLRRPAPMSQKRRLIDDIVQGVLANTKTLLEHKEWASPNKLYNASQHNHSVESEAGTPKRQEIFDKENLSFVNTPNKSPRNFKTDTSRAGVKTTDYSLYFNAENIETLKNKLKCEEKVEKHEHFGKEFETGESQNYITATKDRDTKIISNDSNITKNVSNNTKSDSNGNKKDSTSTRRDLNCTKNKSTDTKTESMSTKSDLNSSKNDSNDTISDSTGSKNDLNYTKKDSESNEIPMRPVKARKCKILSPKTSSKNVNQIKAVSNRFGINEKRKFKSLSSKRSDENKTDSENVDTTSTDLDITAKESDISLKDLDITAKESDISLKDLDITSKELDISLKDLDITSKELDISLKDLDITSKELDTSLKDIDITSENLETTAKKSGLATKIDEATIDSIIIDTLKSKKIDIQQDSSLEISENNQSVNINVIKIEGSPTTTESYHKLQFVLPETPKSGYKFNLLNENSAEKKDFVDLESFKKEYLTEVGKEFVCNYKHKHENNVMDERKFKSPIDFALDAVTGKKSTDSVKKATKRRWSGGGVILSFDNNVEKKRKVSESDLQRCYKDGMDKKEDESADDHNTVDTSKADKRQHKTKDRRKKKKNKKRSGENKNIEVTINSEKRSSKKREKIKTKLAIKNRNISLKIKLKKGSNSSVSLNIESKNELRKTKKKRPKIKENNNHSKFKQYVLQFPEGSSKEVLVKPEKEVCPLKRKYMKQEKSPDKMKQTSIQSFFKIKSEKHYY